MIGAVAAAVAGAGAWPGALAGPGAGAIIQTGTLAKVVLYSVAAGVGISVVVGAGVSSIASLLDAMREHRTAAGAAWAVLAGLCLATAATVVVLGLIVMASK